jgi:hypothetical protein
MAATTRNKTMKTSTIKIKMEELFKALPYGDTVEYLPEKRCEGATTREPFIVLNLIFMLDDELETKKDDFLFYKDMLEDGVGQVFISIKVDCRNLEMDETLSWLMEKYGSCDLYDGLFRFVANFGIVDFDRGGPNYVYNMPAPIKYMRPGSTIILGEQND